MAAATSKDLKLPAHQQFMSSSYPSLKKAWRCTSRHSNIMTTVLTCATNFMVKTLFLIYWVFLTCFGLWCCRCSNLKLPGVLVRNWLNTCLVNRFVGELSKDLPNGDICPRISRRLNEIKEMRYGKSSLVVGGFIVEGGDGQPVDWEARELKDSLSDLQDFGRNTITKLDECFQTSYSELNRVLHNCLDFGKLFSACVGLDVMGKCRSIKMHIRSLEHRNFCQLPVMSKI